MRISQMWLTFALITIALGQESLAQRSSCQIATESQGRLALSCTASDIHGPKTFFYLDLNPGRHAVLYLTFSGTPAMIMKIFIGSGLYFSFPLCSYCSNYASLSWEGASRSFNYQQPQSRSFCVNKRPQNRGEPATLCASFNCRQCFISPPPRVPVCGINEIYVYIKRPWQRAQNTVAPLLSSRQPFCLGASFRSASASADGNNTSSSTSSNSTLSSGD